MKTRRLMAVTRKESLHILRDPRSLAMALALPLLMLWLFGWALSLDVDQIPTAVVDLDRSPSSRLLISQLEGSRFFQVLPISGRQELNQALNGSRCIAGWVIPADFEETLLSGNTVDVQLLVEGSDSYTAGIALSYAENIVARMNEDLQTQQVVIDLRPRILFNPTLESKNFIVPGLVAVILTIIGALLSSLTLAREKENGSLEALLATPVRAAELVLGKMFAYFLLGAVDTVLAVSLGVGLFGVPFRGSVLLLVLSATLFLFGVLCWGILISSIAPNQLVAYQMGVLSTFLPAFLLSGFIFSIENMPVVVQAVTHIVPARYFIELLRGIFLKGAGWAILWPSLLFLGGFAILTFTFATRRLSRVEI